APRRPRRSPRLTAPLPLSFSVRCWMFAVRGSAPAHARPQFFARVVRASPVSAKASRLRELLECNHILTEGAASKWLLSLAPAIHHRRISPASSGLPEIGEKNVRN